VLEDYPAEFRERVLRRAAEKEGLAAAAREFGVPPDLVFRWLKQDAESAYPSIALLARPHRQASASPPSAQPRQTDPDNSWALTSIYLPIFGPVLLLFAVGHVLPSAEARRACLPVWIALGLGMFAWQIRTSNRRLEARGTAVPLSNRLAIACVHAVLSALSTCTLALALPAIPHRWMSTAIEVRTVVASKSIHRSKTTSYCLGTPSFDARLEPVHWCTDRQTFDRAQEGETIVLRGTTSWFGFTRDDFALVPPVAASAIQARAPTAATGASAPSRPAARAPAIIPETFHAGPAEPVRAERAPLRDEPLRAWPGDDQAKIAAAYPGGPAPVEFHSPDPANRQLLWLQDRGLRFFLRADGTINIVRLDPPFAGTVDGIRLGDRLDEIRRRLGSPATDAGGRPRGAFANSVRFDTSAGYRIRVDLDADQRARTIFLLR